MTILSRDSVFVYLAQQTNFISEVEIAIDLDSSVSLVRQRLRDLGDAVETDGDGNWRIKTEQEQRFLTWTSDERYVWCNRQSGFEIEEVSDRSLLLKELEKLHNLRQELFIHAHNTADERRKDYLLAGVRDKDRQINSLKQKLGLSETDNYEIELYIHFLRRDGGTQPRAVIDETTVSEYAEAIEEGAIFPPVTVFFDREQFWLADGFHRVRALEKIGLLKVTVEVKEGSLRDAVLYSCGANATHGLRRLNADKRRAVLRLLEDREWSQWSDRSIARRCGVHHKMVGRLRSSLEQSSSERKYTTKHGTKATMKTEKIGKTDLIKEKQQKENQGTIKESLDLKKAKNKSIKPQKKEGLNYKAGLGCEWYVKVNQETYERIKDYQGRLGIATLDRVINELLDLAQDTNRDG
ncbi:MAG: ParB/RepB/Spo0J family partition protein [Xenococcaceae cyanobacterium MO_207.B15]|nr:ParB/RepB/Spo0J family partition protein [Xenococcaceae cyanobacterium MO_207.B15]